MSLVTIVRNLETIKENLPRRQAYPDVLKVMLAKQEELENKFLDELQKLRLKEGASTTYGAYANWYKSYKKVEQL